MISDAPDILGEPTYVEKADGIQMELVCIVHASPAATVSWYRNDQPIRAQQVWATDALFSIITSLLLLSSNLFSLYSCDTPHCGVKPSL